MGDAAAALGGLDVLVNNVGIARQARFEDVADEEWDAYWQLNVMSYVRAIRAALPLLRASGGAIVNVSSTAGKRPSSGMPHYSVTKAAVLSLSRLVADLYAKDGIRCNAVTPGPTETDAWLGDGGLADQQGDRDEVLAKVGAGRPLGRLARARRDRFGDRVPLLRALLVRDGGGLERRRRHGSDHHLMPSGPRAVRVPSRWRRTRRPSTASSFSGVALGMTTAASDSGAHESVSIRVLSSSSWRSSIDESFL